jgi:TPR repeat protein
MKLFTKYLTAGAVLIGLANVAVVIPSASAQTDALQRVAAARSNEHPFWKTRSLADQGDAVAQYEMGRRFEMGDGLPRNLESAHRWYTRAAVQGNSWAQNNLGRLYGSGDGVTRNYITAHMWFTIAAKDSNRAAKFNREYTANRMTTMEVRKARILADQWLRDHPAANLTTSVETELDE